MEYTYDLIHMTNDLVFSDTMYSFVLLKARANLYFNGIRCFLDGVYILFLNDEDVIDRVNGRHECENLQYELYFININLDSTVIGDPIYESMRAQHRYPDFHLFRTRNENYFGIIPISVPEYDTAKLCFERARRHIAGHATDVMWSYRTRSDMFSS